MTSRPSPCSERPPADVAVRWRRRGVRIVCAVLVGMLTMTACSGSDTSAASPTADPSTVDQSAVAGATPAPTTSGVETPGPSASDPATTAPASLTTETASASEEASASVAAIVVDRADPAAFDYDQVRPVDVEMVGTEDYFGTQMTRIEFPSQDGGMATGYLALPADQASDVGILWAHDLPANGRDSFAPMAVFACAGATSIVVNAPYARSVASRPDGVVTNGSQPLTFSPTDRDEQIQLIRDMRRAIDVLQDRGTERIGFGGLGYGAAMGAALIGVDDRIEAAKLTLGNSGLVEHFTDEDGTPSFHLDDLTAEEVNTWVQAMLPIEPARFIDGSEAAILFLNGRNDPIVPTAEAERFHATVPGAEVRWTNAGHDVSYEDFLFFNSWLGTNLGLDTDRLDACAEQIFPGGW